MSRSSSSNRWSVRQTAQVSCAGVCQLVVLVASKLPVPSKRKIGPYPAAAESLSPAALLATDSPVAYRLRSAGVLFT
ncbi:unnamed protein product [Heligmosomoides polygyrus]|uniref:Secreted protein n=1 Tax=Heligmosomoides polygyrus TaxID=6339 RepID=A0A183FMR6_HELPZ|nr:unnamed protein product [Heligmosomoides polygyrus]